MLLEEADCRRVWKSVVRRIDGWTRFLSKLDNVVENGRGNESLSAIEEM